MLWPAINMSKLKPPLSMSHSTKTISSHKCSFFDEARRHKRLDTFRMTVSNVITDNTLKQNNIRVSLIRHSWTLNMGSRQHRARASCLPDSNPYGHDGLAHSRSLSPPRGALVVLPKSVSLIWLTSFLFKDLVFTIVLWLFLGMSEFRVELTSTFMLNYRFTCI